MSGKAGGLQEKACNRKCKIYTRKSFKFCPNLERQASSLMTFSMRISRTAAWLLSPIYRATVVAARVKAI